MGFSTLNPCYALSHQSSWGLKLGQEYRHSRGLTPDPVENWIERADLIPNI
jgi:hypothetical protein